MNLEENFQNSMKANSNYNLDSNRLGENNQRMFDLDLKDNFSNDNYSAGIDNLEKNSFPFNDNKEQPFRTQVYSSNKRQNPNLPPLPSNYLNRNTLLSEQFSNQNVYMPSVSRQNSQLNQQMNMGVFSGNFSTNKSDFIWCLPNNSIFNN